VSLATTVKVVEKPAVKRSPMVRQDVEIPVVATVERKVRLVPDLRELWSYINPFMLYGRHMGYRGNFEKHLAAREAKAVERYNEMEEVIGAEFARVRFGNSLRPRRAIATFAPGRNSC
jgi:5-methyltetrahydrofolate--homocysteine methyltransferase